MWSAFHPRCSSTTRYICNYNCDISLVISNIKLTIWIIIESNQQTISFIYIFLRRIEEYKNRNWKRINRKLDFSCFFTRVHHCLAVCVSLYSWEWSKFQNEMFYDRVIIPNAYSVIPKVNNQELSEMVHPMTINQPPVIRGISH